LFQKANEPVQTCLEMALEGLMTPLPGVNCIHTLRKPATTTEKSTTKNVLDVRGAFNSKIVDDNSFDAALTSEDDGNHADQDIHEPTNDVADDVTVSVGDDVTEEVADDVTDDVTVEVADAVLEEVANDVIEEVADDVPDVVTDEVADDVIVKPGDDDAGDDVVAYDVDLNEGEVKEGGKLVAVESFPIVGRDFDLATKLIRLNPRQTGDE
jgi:hypothetical protein